ncbi:MAG TPA: DUF2510 domain-containing protein [Jatrophihabitantaceae bacterium]
MSAGWFPDPAGQHEHRYYDGTQWTAHVSDRGVAAVDPIPPPPAPTAQSMSAWTDTQMRAVATWWRGRQGQQHDSAFDPQTGLPFASAPPDLPLLDDPGEQTILGPWSGLAGAVGHYALATSGIEGGGELLGVLHAITGAQDAQGKLLQRIDQKLDALVFGPYQTGRTHLSEAARVGEGDPTQKEHITEAKECFYSAHGQAASVQSRALVEYHLAMTWLLLDRRSDAKHWFHQSYESSVAVVNELARQTADVRVLKSRGSTAAVSYFYPAGLVVLGMKFKKMLAAQQARDMLNDYLPFLACTARSHNSLAEPDAHVPALRLTPNGQTYDLVETTA